MNKLIEEIWFSKAKQQATEHGTLLFGFCVQEHLLEYGGKFKYDDAIL